MASGSVSCTSYCAASSSLSITASLNVSSGAQSVSENYTKIDYSFSAKRNAYGFVGTTRPHAGKLQVWINGSCVKEVYVPLTYNASGGNTECSGSGSVNVYHNNDGTKSFNYQIKIVQGVDDVGKINWYWNGSTSTSKSMTLTTIPRASSISSLTSSVDVDGNNSVSVSINRKSSSFTHEVVFQVNSNYKQTYSGVETSQSFVIPVTWLNAIGSNSSITATCYVTTYNGNSKIGDTVSDTFTLKKPSPSTFTCTESIECNGSNSLKLNINRANVSFKHKVEFNLGNYNESFSNVDTSKEYAPSMEWLNEIPNATIGNGVVKVTTYYGSIFIGENSKTFKLIVPTSVIPTISDIVSEIINPSTISSWGIYLQNISKCNLNVNAIGAFSSTITSYVFDGISQSENTKITDVIKSSGTVSFKIYAKDSRGRSSKEETVSISVEPYSLPSLSCNMMKRCLSDGTVDDEGEYIIINCSFDCSSCSGKNSTNAKVYTREILEGEYTEKVSIISGSSVVISNYDISKSYTVKIVATDLVGNSVSYIGIIDTSSSIINILKGGRGIAFNMMASKDDTMQIGYSTLEMNNGVIVLNYIDEVTGNTIVSLIGNKNVDYINYETNAPKGHYFSNDVTINGCLDLTNCKLRIGSNEFDAKYLLYDSD